VPRGRDRPLLVVDGDLTALRASERAVNLLGYRAVAEPDADAALRLCAEEPPVAVIFAPFLLGMDPFTFLAHLMRVRNGAGFPVLLSLPRNLAGSEEGQRLVTLATEAIGAQALDPRAFVTALEARCANETPSRV
jgi:hypothetical protein